MEEQRKRPTRPQMSCFLLKISEEQKKKKFTIGVYISISARGPHKNGLAGRMQHAGRSLPSPWLKDGAIFLTSWSEFWEDKFN